MFILSDYFLNFMPFASDLPLKAFCHRAVHVSMCPLVIVITNFLLILAVK